LHLVSLLLHYLISYCQPKVYRIVPLSMMTLSDLWPGFQGHDIFWSRIS